ncbi:MAG TPA: TolC family protein [Cytophagaceae bacterium]|jgi:outer membrane protein|nr:TolC family protein [Cytophagaceae bacterium]
MNFNKIIILLGITYWVATPTVMAQQSAQALTLKDCIDYTLGKNPNNIVFNNQIEIAGRQKTEGMAAYLPQLNFTGALDDNLQRPTTVIPAGAFSPVPLRVQFGNQYATTLNLKADQVIYDQSLIEGIKANKPNIELAVLKKLRNDDDLIYNTAAAYYQVLVYKEQLKLLAENEKKFSDLLTIQKLQYEKGVITRVSMNRVQVNYNNILSQKKVAETNYALSMNCLKNNMGIDIDQQIIIVDSIDYKQETNFPLTTDFNIKSKPDYQILEKNIRMQEIDLKRKRASNLPTLNAYAQYGTNTYGNDFIKSYNQHYDYSAVGLRLNVPIFSSLKRYSQIKQSELTLKNTRQTLIINSQTLKLQLQNANTQLISSYNNMQSNKNNLGLAKEVFDDTNLQYQKGTATLTDFLNADYSYKESQYNYINALLTYLTSRIDLERSKGTIKQFASQL